MELKSLILGLFFSLGIFAFKNGVGLHYLLSYKQNSARKIIFIIFTYSLSYVLLFTFSYIVIKQIELLQHFQGIQNLMQSGMLLHFILAALLSGWGFLLLKHKHNKNKISYGWLPLIVPCPVCLTVIFFNVAFLLSFAPDTGFISVLLTTLGFVAFSISTAIILSSWTNKTQLEPESTLGSAMLFIAAYFILSVIVMPQFNKLDEIYRLASYQGNKGLTNPSELILLIAFLGSGFLIGFLIKLYKLKGLRIWPLARS